MSSLSKEKRNQILLILGGTLGIFLLVYYFIIGSQSEKLMKLQGDILISRNEVYTAESRIRLARRMSPELTTLSNEVVVAEARMMPVEQLKGNKWLYDKLMKFKKDKYDVELINISNQPLTGDLFLLLPNFSYSAAAYNVEMRAFFHEFGRFLADFENSFPFMRIDNLTLWPVATPSGATGPTSDAPEGFAESDDLEQLGISLRVVVLYKPPVT